MSFLDGLDPKYRLILCDLWGVVHNGVQIFPGASARLKQWRSEGRRVVLLTNAPRTAGAVAAQLAGMGLDKECWDAIATSGEAGIASLRALEKPVGFIGTSGDREILEDAGVRIASGAEFSDLACTGLEEGRGDPEDYRCELKELARRDVRLHCLNPDRVVVRGGVPEACAGALAEIFESLGGSVTWYGKPFSAIYDHALRLGGNPRANQVLAVGDGLQTDVLGAALMHFDTVFVSGGIHEGEPFPRDFAAKNGLGDWHPIGIVETLG